MSTRQPIPAEQFTDIQWVKTYEYDNGGQRLIRQTHRKAIDGPLINERIFSYDDAGQLVEINFTGYFADQTEATRQRMVFENGILKSYYYDGVEPGTSFQASFTITSF